MRLVLSSLVGGIGINTRPSLWDGGVEHTWGHCGSWEDAALAPASIFWFVHPLPLFIWFRRTTNRSDLEDLLLYINSLFNNPEKTGNHSSFKLGTQDSFESIFILIFLLKNEGAGLLGLSFCPDDCDYFFLCLFSNFVSSDQTFLILYAMTKLFLTNWEKNLRKAGQQPCYLALESSCAFRVFGNMAFQSWWLRTTIIITPIPKKPLLL